MNKTYRGYKASDKPRCRSCKCFIESKERVVCPNCGTANRRRIV